jgi:hypothetical protein
VQAPEVCDDGSANGSPGHCKADCSGVPAHVSIKGDVFAFMNEVNGPRVAGATVSILERPDKSTTTGADGHFEIDGLDEGSEATVVLSDPNFYPTQSATYVLGPKGIDPFALQVLSNGLFNVLSQLFPDLNQNANCAVATTITRLGGTVHVRVRQGEAGATLAISPASSGVKGPVYFNDKVLPDTTLTSSSIDGGAFYYNVSPGTYALTAAKPGFTFTTAKVTCRAGWLVNAGPPIGVQSDVKTTDWGPVTAAADAMTASTDALCQATGDCVNAMNGAGAYPPATVASCKATFQRALALVDASCDASTHVTGVWKAFFDCRAGSCALTLGDDTACATEESAFAAAMQQYAPCYAAAHGK